MSRQIVAIQKLSIIFPQKTCLEEFSQSVQEGDRIALLGPNGGGKSSLLRAICGGSGFGGVVRVAEGVVLAAVPQISGAGDGLSGGERSKRALTEALAKSPNLLLLDEPTNHLDVRSRGSLISLLEHFSGTLLFASHDDELLERCGKIFWHLENGSLRVFRGSYGDYRRSLEERRSTLERELERLGGKRKELEEKIQAEQRRAKRSRAVGRANGKKDKWDKCTTFAKSQWAERSSGKNLRRLDEERRKLAERLSDIRLPPAIVPTFHLSGRAGGSKIVLSIRDGSVAYGERKVLEGINLTLFSGERLAIAGRNGSGKSTLLRAIGGDPALRRWGCWDGPAREDIGLLDQDYGTVDRSKSPLENLRALVPHWSVRDLRKHLQSFLFQKDGEISLPASQLSGGELVRLALALVAARTPKLLILDEAANNVDRETRRHMVAVLRDFPAALLAVSHDENFLLESKITRRWPSGLDC
ncbi:MAG: ATP-binding cassette domain-containing protein [Puniceicoccales bacterium]|jgi:ATPase subunit of ABC transporter with duplicated ATPase domains|nr:ATP-binding cassette domain-containing protein [Puniceicoccales bacterium]